MLELVKYFYDASGGDAAKMSISFELINDKVNTKCLIHLKRVY